VHNSELHIIFTLRDILLRASNKREAKIGKACSMHAKKSLKVTLGRLRARRENNIKVGLKEERQFN
jgi:hypothetical protein